jgi:isopentenyl phosphate kinase
VVGGLIFVKLGGSVITDKKKPFTERRRLIKSLAEEIYSSHRHSDFNLIIGHGGGSYPHTPAGRYQTHKGIVGDESTLGIALVQDAASRLNRIIVSYLLEAGEKAISVQPSSALVASNGRIVSWDLATIRLMLKLGLVPVTYGDVGLDQVKGCCILSTEEIFCYLARHLKPDRIIIGTDVDGVYEGDPKKDKDAKKIPIITPKNAVNLIHLLGGAGGLDVTGGMRTKVATLLDLVREVDVECEVLNIARRGVLEKALKGERGIGTIIRRE